MKWPWKNQIPEKIAIPCPLFEGMYECEPRFCTMWNDEKSVCEYPEISQNPHRDQEQVEWDKVVLTLSHSQRRKGETK